MKHLERAYAGNNFMPWYVLIFILTLFTQAILATISLYLENSYQVSNKSIILLLLMIPFAITLPIFGLLTRTFHQRNVTAIINGREKIRWKRILHGFLCWFLLMGGTSLIVYFLHPEQFTYQFDINKFIPLLVISIIFIPLQAAFEEILFRGYIMQGIGTFTKSRWIAIIVSSLLFALLHNNNPEMDKYGQIMFFSYLSMAIIWAVISVLDDGIEIPIGMHFANNLFISLFTSEKGAAFETDAIFEISHSNPYLGLLLLLLSGTLCIIYFKTIYKWDFKTLQKKVEKPTNNTPSVS